MSVLVDRFPVASRTVNAEPRGPLTTRPFGLDAFTNSTPADLSREPAFSVDPESQLSRFGDELALDTDIRMEGTLCNTESDGKDVIAVDEDQNDD